MFKKKCGGCGEKVERGFNYCPKCGFSLKTGSNNDFGMLGADDFGGIQKEIKLPFGLEKMMGSLIKQFEKQLGEMDMNNEMPKGFKIQIGRGPTGQQVVHKAPAKRMPIISVSKEEAERRIKLEKVNAQSNVKRLGDVIVYEISAPGIRKKEDVIITELETGIEIRAYTKDKCYIKTIPLKVEVLRWKVSDEMIVVEIKG